MADDALAPLTTPRLDAIRAPLPGDAPAGIDMKYEDDFQTLKDLVDALGAATGDVDFDGIVSLATSILSEKSKDLAVASYLMLGLTRTAGYAGIAEGVAAVRAVTEGFWEDAFPPLRRMRGRQASLQFVAERTSAWVKGNRAEPDDRESLQHAEAEVTALQAFVMEAMGDDAPAFSGLLREIREALRRLPKPAEPEPPAEEAGPEDPPAASGDAPASAPAAASGAAPARAAPAASVLPSGEVSSRSAAETLVGQAAGFFSEQSPTSAVPFLLNRALLWGEVAQAPESGFVPAPLPHRREGFATMLAAANHALLVSEAESEFTQNPFWLDLQRYLATALKALGPPAALAHAAVEESTAALVRRLPGLPSLTYDDGTPFADPMTVTWLSDLTAAAGGGGPASPSDQAVRDAQAQASGGDLPGAVAALMSGAGAPRDRFERAVAAAELCVAAGRADVALGLLDDADAAIQTYRLDVWDPAAAAKALRLLYTCCASLKTAPASPQRVTVLIDRADEAFDRLSRLDPAHALRSTPAPES